MSEFVPEDHVTLPKVYLESLRAEIDRLKEENENLHRSWTDAQIIANKFESKMYRAESMCDELAGALKDLCNHGLQYENGEIHQADPQKAMEALKKYTDFRSGDTAFPGGGEMRKGEKHAFGSTDYQAFSYGRIVSERLDYED